VSPPFLFLFLFLQVRGHVQDQRRWSDDGVSPPIPPDRGTTGTPVPQKGTIVNEIQFLALINALDGIRDELQGINDVLRDMRDVTCGPVEASDSLLSQWGTDTPSGG
jgi:hypothetical protein